MANLTTRFFGLDLKSPIIIGSSGLTSSVEKIKMLEKFGAGAVVLKSVFEEEIYAEFEDEFNKQSIGYANQEYLDYFDYEIKNDKVKHYLQLISEAKSSGVKIPIVASINCTSGSDWAFFARKLASAGVDALELNLFVMPSDVERDAQSIRHYYFHTIKKVMAEVSIPVAIKISSYFSDLALMIKDLSETGVAGITLFNRFYNVDIDIDTKELVAAKVLSYPFEYLEALRWIGITSPIAKCNLAASTGVQDYQTAIKMLMSGASAVQVVSGVYKHGYDFIEEMNKSISRWMDANNYENLNDLIGVASSKSVENPTLYQRVQFMKHFGGFTGSEEE